MRRATVGPDGTLVLGDDAERLGFVPGAPVEIIVTSAGSLLVCLDRSPPAIDAAFRPLYGGAAQLARRNALKHATMGNDRSDERAAALQSVGGKGAGDAAQTWESREDEGRDLE